ncbi:MAG: L,D-transpeptidase [Myxococcales bacterium]|nr:L,D-transpeptidase [Myxococcales bacterium]
MNEANIEPLPSHGLSTWISRKGRGLSAICVGALLCVLSGCELAEAHQANEQDSAQLQEAIEGTKPAPTAMKMTVKDDAAEPGVATELAPPAEVAEVADAPAPAAPAAPEAEVAPTPAERSPIAIRTARQRLTVRIAPDHGAPIRARIPMGESFEVFELVPGRDCGGKGWADVGNGGFVCLSKTRKATEDPRTLPAVDDGVLPYYFAKIPEGKSARRWKSLRSYHAGDEPQIITAPGRDFAFKSRLRAKGRIVLVDDRGRVMAERDLHRYRPSSFEGRNLLAQPVPEGQQLAWAVQWPQTEVYTEADATSEPAPSLEYHAEIYIAPEPVRTAKGTFFALADGRGFVAARNLRRMLAVPQLGDETLADDEIWLDVDLDQQVLTVMEGSLPIYATLISSGHKGPTPRGLFRINKKQAVGSMSSEPGAADPYAVEAVPYVQYFSGGIALHSAYWHDRFGHRKSHGCVNLSPLDARWVFEWAGPTLPKGWTGYLPSDLEHSPVVHVRDTSKGPGATFTQQRPPGPPDMEAERAKVEAAERRRADLAEAQDLQDEPTDAWEPLGDGAVPRVEAPRPRNP